MSASTFTPEEIARFLASNPDFFQEHAEVFSELRVPHPHETRAISLGERQILTLRAKTKDLEWRLSGLINNASGNEKISRTLTSWCCRMLAEPQAERLPQLIVEHLSSLFELPNTTLKVWGLSQCNDTHFTDGITEEIKQYANALNAPYCGPVIDQPVLAWLSAPAQSLAVVPMKDDSGVFGLLVLGAEDKDRFQPDMGTAFLEILSSLASSALSRLK
ncbi:DUF484 family protein [Neopusillimonas maritima]|jgi:uncharacterized protein YigA (DUF484 family)|uniref:DUF484 domain-containing protein n=1 Tax=Neopusillimonas maritima TaxID=2026239 RepID=A0ABX9MTV7_9BURK|nr:DUF484 family protein [Neopusillimonas maritima]MBF22454.1 hypothetical protein [Pusillimonas sp.]RII82333.1 hypothetical protein CJO09_10545 [Neopusillimonas maritima]|tara:strand:- start:287745 stop:288398 length:654 start_codon:yes stop_codon:yes gene_type:complete